jgi:hypothetical protein
MGQMATLSDLVAVTASVEGLDLGTVALCARHMREAGLIKTGGRGSSAAAMELPDAANLLIGVNTAKSAPEAPRATRRFRALHAYEFRSESDPRAESDWGALGDAIEQLIMAADTGRTSEPFFGTIMPELEEAFSNGDVHVGLTFNTTKVSATVKIWPLPGKDAVDPDAPDRWAAQGLPVISLLFSSPRPRGTPRAMKQERTADRTEEVTIGYKTFRAVGKLILPS